MSMIACKECSHQISDKAESCPSCGAPTATPPKRRPIRRALYAMLVTFAAIWLIGAAFWIVRMVAGPERSIGEAAESTEENVKQPSPVGSPLPTNRFASTDRTSSAEPGPAPRLVYQITAEQLYQDYSTNGVATQSRIGESRIRVTGTVAVIDEDSSGHPVVKLAAGDGSSADMTLTTDQTGAAAQLVKGETVDIECDRMRHVLGSPDGSDCVLVLVDARPKQVYAASGSSTGDVAKASRHVARRKAEALPAVSVPGPAEASLQGQVPPEAVAFVSEDQDIPAPRATAPAAVQNVTPTGGAIAPSVEATARSAVPSATGIETGIGVPGVANIRLASAAPPPAAPQSTSAPLPPGASDDELAPVRAADPQAAQHIVSYCDSTSATAANRTDFETGCKRDEAGAWERMVLHKEFPALDDATRRKCSEPPFPDSYVAKELCAKYELHLE